MLESRSKKGETKKEKKEDCFYSIQLEKMGGGSPKNAINGAPSGVVQM